MTKFYTMDGGSKCVKGKKYRMVVGSRANVWHGTACHTKGGLKKSDLILNKRGRIVSRRKSASAKRERRLEKAGYKTRKGTFGFVKATASRGRSRRSRGRSHRRRRHRGGAGINLPLSPAKFDGRGVGTSGVDLQFVAGNATS